MPAPSLSREARDREIPGPRLWGDVNAYKARIHTCKARIHVYNRASFAPRPGPDGVPLERHDVRTTVVPVGHS